MKSCKDCVHFTSWHYPATRTQPEESGWHCDLEQSIEPSEAWFESCEVWEQIISCLPDVTDEHDYLFAQFCEGYKERPQETILAKPNTWQETYSSLDIDFQEESKNEL